MEDVAHLETDCIDGGALGCPAIFSPDNKFIASGNGKHAQLWWFEENKTVKFKPPGICSDINRLATCAAYVAAAHSCTVNIWSVADLHAAGTADVVLVPPRKSIEKGWTVGPMAASGSNVVFVLQLCALAYKYSIDTDILLEAPPALFERGDTAYSIACSKDASLVVVGYSAHLQIWDTVRNVNRVIGTNGGWIWGLAVSSDASRVAISSDGHRRNGAPVSVWPLRQLEQLADTNQPLPREDIVHELEPFILAFRVSSTFRLRFTEDGENIFASTDWSVSMHDVRTGVVLHGHSANSERFSVVSANSDGSLAVVSTVDWSRSTKLAVRRLLGWTQPRSFSMIKHTMVGERCHYAIYRPWRDTQNKFFSRAFQNTVFTLLLVVYRLGAMGCPVPPWEIWLMCIIPLIPCYPEYILPFWHDTTIRPDSYNKTLYHRRPDGSYRTLPGGSFIDPLALV